MVVLITPALASLQILGPGYLDQEVSALRFGTPTALVKRSLHAPPWVVHPNSDESTSPHFWLRAPASPRELALTAHFTDVYEHLTPERKARFTSWRPFRFVLYRVANLKVQRPEAFVHQQLSEAELRALEHRHREEAVDMNRRAAEELLPWDEPFGPDAELLGQHEDVVHHALELTRHWPVPWQLHWAPQERHGDHQQSLEKCNKNL